MPILKLFQWYQPITNEWTTTHATDDDVINDVVQYDFVDQIDILIKYVAKRTGALEQ